MAKKRANGEGNIRKRKDGRWEGRYTAGYDEKTGKVTLGDRPVHEYTLSNDIAYIEPKARVY